MKILVCIKQVPGTTKVDIDEKTGVLKREGVESKMNPYDLYALETAFKIREKVGGIVTVVTMGPPQAEKVIREAYSLGADDGYILTDRRFAGADVLATSYTLFQGISSIGNFDLIICGKQTTDGDTAQVGPAMAEHFKIPHVAWVSSIKYVDGEKIMVEQDMADSFEMVELPYPCLITVEKGIFEPRLPSYRKKLETISKPINVVNLNSFSDNDGKNYGLNGSATQVERIFPPEANNKREIWEGTPKDLACKLFNNLSENKFL